MSERSDIELLRDIQESIEKVRLYTAGMTFEDFERDERTADAVARNFSIIGEAAGRLSKRVIETYREVPWKDITGMRHKIVHDYFSLDYEIIWAVVESDLPGFLKKINQILDEL